MNERHLLEIIRGDVPARDELARERARTRLRSVMLGGDQPKAGRGRRLAWLSAAAAAIVVTVLLLQTALPPGAGGPNLSAASELRRLGRIASGTSPLTPGMETYVYTRYVEYRADDRNFEGHRYVLAERVTVESWFAADGSGLMETTFDDVQFASETDRAEWLKAGSPEIPQEGSTDPQRYDAGEFPILDVSTIPTDPQGARTVLESGDVIGGTEGPARLLSSIGVLLGQQNLSGAQRQALFEVAAGIDGIQVMSGVDDLGRPSTVVSVLDTSDSTTLYFDPADAELNEQSGELPKLAGGETFTTWRGYELAAEVGQIGETP